MSQLHPKTLKFLSGLKRNNNKEWFEKNRATYEAIRNSFIEVVNEVIGEMNKFDATLGQLEGKSCVFRINRDVRFSKNKSPYKNNIGAYISRGGRKSPAAGYYLHVQPGDSFAGGGIWMPEAERLSKIRQEIDYNFKDFKKIVESKSFKKVFKTLDDKEKLLRPPKKYLPENPAIEYLKMKSFVAGVRFKDEEVLSKNYVKKLASVFRELHPFIIFLNQSVD